MVVTKIEITNRFGFDELVRRLNEVKLRGFSDVKIYEGARIQALDLSPSQIRQQIFTPQPTVYRTHLDRVNKMAELFVGHGIDIFNLDGGVDYDAYDDSGEVTQWTLIPPVVEVVPLAFRNGRLDYEQLINDEVRKLMQTEGHNLNPALLDLEFEDYVALAAQLVPRVPLICDGSHRIHAAVENDRTQKVLLIDGPKFGYPYYAAPKPYALLDIIPDRPDGGGKDKIDVIEGKGYKNLYRLFPSGGIKSGDLRPDTEKLGV